MRECLVASVVAAVGAFAVEAYEAPVSVDRAAYLALGVALLGALGLVYRLGAGIHGLGRRGAVSVVSGIGLLSVGLAYTEALSRWGTGDSSTRQRRGRHQLGPRDVGGVPRPTEFLLGFPALAWGVSTRARRRQGWWVCAFGARRPPSVVDHVTARPRGAARPRRDSSWATASSLGLGLGYAVVRADAYLTGTRGRRARKLEEQAAPPAGAGAHRSPAVTAAA